MAVFESQKSNYNYDDYSNKSMSKEREEKIANTRFNLIRES